MATTPGSGDPAHVEPGAVGPLEAGDEGVEGEGVEGEEAGPAAAGARHRDLVAELVRMRREEAAEEDEEDLAWFSGVREEVLGAMASNADPKPAVPTGG